MGTISNAVSRWWRNWRAARSSMAMLDACGAEETERIAHDVGVSASELRTLAGKWPDSAALLNRRLAALQLDPVEIGRSERRVLSDLQRVCTICVSSRECTHDLARDPDDPVWRQYCPNVVTLDALSEERLERRAGRQWRLPRGFWVSSIRRPRNRRPPRKGA